MSEAFINYTDQHITLIGLFIFIVFFGSVLFLACRRSMKSHFQYMSELPISDNKGETLS